VRTRSLLLPLPFVTALALAGCADAKPAPRSDPEPGHEARDQIDLKDHFNVKRGAQFHSPQFPNNNLKALKSGTQKLGDVTYGIGEGVLQLGSAGAVGKPARIEGIRVGRRADKLHILHGTGNTADFGTVVCRYVIRYTDKTNTDIKVVYGKHVVDWWWCPGRVTPTVAKAVWEGENEAARLFRAKVRLYQLAWTNPLPEKVIDTIDYVIADPAQLCAPFCVAMTAELEKAPAEQKNTGK
jgi:hypothetical protein